MIVDVHAHLALTEGSIEDQRERQQVIASALCLSMDRARKLRLDMVDPSGEKLIAEMDEGGVDISVVVQVDNTVFDLLSTGREGAPPIERSFEALSDVVKRHPGRLTWGAGIDPRRGNAAKLADKAVRELGARIIKLYPPAGFYPNDNVVYPLYRKAVELGVPVQIHTAPVAQNKMRSKFCQPICYDDVAVDFPELKIQIIHSGVEWSQDVLAIAQRRKNMFLDVAAWSRRLNANHIEYYRRIREMMNRAPGRVMWASDGVVPGINPQASWVRAF